MELKFVTQGTHLITVTAVYILHFMFKELILWLIFLRFSAVMFSMKQL